MERKTININLTGVERAVEFNVFTLNGKFEGFSDRVFKGRIRPDLQPHAVMMMIKEVVTKQELAAYTKGNYLATVDSEGTFWVYNFDCTINTRPGYIEGWLEG